MMLPAVTAWPPKIFTPRRFDSESRPFLLLPPAFLCATVLYPFPAATGLDPANDLRFAPLFFPGRRLLRRLLRGLLAAGRLLRRLLFLLFRGRGFRCGLGFFRGSRGLGAGLRRRPADRGDLDLGEPLPVRVLPQVVHAALELRDADLAGPPLAHHPRGHGRAGEERRADLHVAPLTHEQHLVEAHVRAFLGVDLLDLQALALRRTVLFSTGAKHSVHSTAPANRPGDAPGR